MDFVNLHVHSEHSLLDGMLTVDDVVGYAVANGHPGACITDHGVMGSCWKLYKAATAAGVKPLIGIELYVVPNVALHPAKEKRRHITAIARDWQGLQNLFKLSGRGHTEGFYRRPRVQPDWIKMYSEGVIFLSGCMDGMVAMHILEGRPEKALAMAKSMADSFPNFFIELMPTKIEQQTIINPELVNIAHKLHLPMVATPDAHYLKERQPFHKVLLGINSGGKMWEFTDDCFHLMTGSEMADLMALNHPMLSRADISAAVEGTCAVSDLVNLKYPTWHNVIPQPYPGLTADEEFELLKKLANEGWAKKGWTAKESRPEYQERFNYELNQIRGQDFVRYFLVVHDIYINFVIPQGIMYGTGRGSAAGSLICALLDITEPDPLENGLIFERFIAPDRVTAPDIDMDFEDLRRGEVKQYIEDKYGADNVSNIGTYGTLRGKAVIKDVSRCYNVPISEVMDVTRFVIERSSGDARVSNTVEDTFVEFDECKKFAQRHPEIVPACVVLEGHIRGGGMHAAGVVVAPFRLDDMMPLENRGGKFVTAMDGKEIDEMGLLKLDVLGLRTLTIARDALQMAGLAREDLTKLDYKDPAVLGAFHAGDTVGIFQFNSDGLTKMLTDMPIEFFDDLVAMNALYRPGGMRSGMASDFVARRRGDQPITYEHPIYDEITKDTLGLIVYQEQIMQMFGRMANYSATNIDRMRQKVAKRYGVEAMDEQRAVFVAGCEVNGINSVFANAIFDRMIHFGSYAFNKAHAYVYTQISYWTMWLKVYHPLAFYVACLNNEPDDKEYRKLLAAVLKKGIILLPPHLNRSGSQSSIEGQCIRLGLEKIKGFGPKTVDELIEHQPFIGSTPEEMLKDLYTRVNKRVVNKNIQPLVVKLGLLSDEPQDLDGDVWAAHYPVPVGKRLIAQLKSLTEASEAIYTFRTIAWLKGKGGTGHVRGVMTGVLYHAIGDFGDQKYQRWPKGARYAIVDITDGTEVNRLKLNPGMYEMYKHDLKQGNLFMARVRKMKDLDTMLFVQQLTVLNPQPKES